jgi:arylsulfatase A-like enzyme
MADDEVPQILLDTPLKTETEEINLPLNKYKDETIALTIETTEGEALFRPVQLIAQAENINQAPGRPDAENVILILIDTLRADHLSMYNSHTRVQTPMLDKLAKESMVFLNPIAQENWTKPSVATVLTGLYPQTHNTKTEKNRLPSSALMISEYMKKMGFITAGFVANGYISGKFGFKRGWDHWTNYVREGKPNRAQFVADDVIKWLDKKPDDKPFFLYIQTIDPHVPYIPPNRYRALYDNEPYKGPVIPRDTAKLLEKVKSGSFKLTPRDKIRLEALYDGEISYHDFHLARIYNALKEKGLLENTLIVVTADHGEEFFDHGKVGHGHSMYNELLHVPLIIRLPGASPVQAKSEYKKDVQLVDILPTIFELSSLEIPDDLEGESLVSILKGKDNRSYLHPGFSDFLNGQRVVKTGRFKLIYRGLKTTVFDLKTDPAETTDLSDTRPVTLSMLRDLLGEQQGRFISSNAASDKPLKRQKKAKIRKSENTVIDAETRQQLKALGYMGD